MTDRKPPTPAPGPLEDYAHSFDELFSRRGVRESFRRYLEGLLLPSERNKTLTGLANTEPVVGSVHPRAQQLQWYLSWYLSETSWEPDEVNDLRLKMLVEGEQTVPTESGVVVIDETGDRKWGNKTAHVSRQYLGSIGKVDNGVVSVSSLWADEGVYYPTEVEPYTPAHWYEDGKGDGEFRTKPEIALELVVHVREKQIPFRAVVADSLYGEDRGFRRGLAEREIGYVLALRPSHAWRHREEDVGCVEDVARGHRWSEKEPGSWVKVERSFRDGHTETWWSLEGQGGPYGPTKGRRLVIVTTDPQSMPELTSWYLVTNLPADDPADGPERAGSSELAAADLAEVVRLYGLRMWVEQSYKQVKQTLGWAQYQVRSSIAIRRHWQMVLCAFSFCWWASAPDVLGEARNQPLGVNQKVAPEAARGGKGGSATSDQLAKGAETGARVAGTLVHAATLLESVVGQAPTQTAQRVA